LADNPPPAGNRNSAGVAAVGSRIYVIGGYTYSGTIQQVCAIVEAYDTDTRTWSTKTPMTHARANLVAAAVNGKIYAIGGSCNNPPEYPSATGYVEEYDPVGNTWTDKASMPVAKWDPRAVANGNDISCIGGNSGAPNFLYTYNQVYNTVSNTWTDKARIPATSGPTASAIPILTGFGIGAINGKIYVAAGEASGGGAASLSNTLWSYSDATNAWTNVIPNIPFARERVASFVANDHLFIAGGDTGWAQGLGTTEVWEYLPESLTWKLKNPLPVETHDMRAVKVGATVYLIGGCCPDTNIIVGYPSNAPSLSWVSWDKNYAGRGVDTPIARVGADLTFRIVYSDPDGDVPLDGYPKVVIKKGSTTVATIDMTSEGGVNYVGGVVYRTAWGTLVQGADYTYTFQAKDKWQVDAVNMLPAITDGTLTFNVTSGVFVPSDLAKNQPAAGKMQVRNNVIQLSIGGKAQIVVHTQQTGEKFTVDLYTESGLPVTGISGFGEGPLASDSSGMGSVSFDGKVNGKPLPAGIYWVVVSGGASDKKPVIIVGKAAK